MQRMREPFDLRLSVVFPATPLEMWLIVGDTGDSLATGKSRGNSTRRERNGPKKPDNGSGIARLITQAVTLGNLGFLCFVIARNQAR
jgi:hypothetical protein